jgi:hypothetical protein
MGRYKFNKKTGKSTRVAEYDTTLMMTLKDVLPDDPAIARKYLEKKSNAPKGKLQHLYHTQSNSSLVRKIFVTYMKAVLMEVVMGQGKFVIPNTSVNKPEIYMGWIDDKAAKGFRKSYKYQKFDLMQTDYKIPMVKYKIKDSKQDLGVYVNKQIFAKLLKRSNSGKGFSKLPREIEYFLPVVYEEFSYINERKLQSLIRHCLRRLHYHLRRGEEVRILDGDGEIRFYRPLGRKHDEIMRSVVRKRMARDRNRKYGKLS